MSKKSDTDKQVQRDAEARAQGNKQAREESAGRGQQTVVGERGGQAAVDKARERNEKSDEQLLKQQNEENAKRDQQEAQRRKVEEQNRHQQEHLSQGGHQESNAENTDPNKPTDRKAAIDRDVGQVQDQVERNRKEGKEQGDVTYADASGERQPTTVQADGTTTTQPPQTTQASYPRSLAEGAVHPHGETP